MWAAEQILRLKEQPGYEDIELVVALPFVGHDAKWDQRSKRRMEFILQHCSKKEVIGNEDCRESYVKRNCYMVDQANYLVAVYAGTGSTSRTHGGKSHTARRSQSHGRSRLGAPAPP